MLTDKPNIVIAKPPKRARRKRVPAAPSDTPRVVFAESPSRIRRAAAPARIVVGAETEAMTAEEHARRGEAADRLWHELVAGGDREVTGAGGAAALIRIWQGGFRENGVSPPPTPPYGIASIAGPIVGRPAPQSASTRSRLRTEENPAEPPMRA